MWGSKDSDAPWTGVTGSCEFPSVDIGSSTGAGQVLNTWAISQAQKLTLSIGTAEYMTQKFLNSLFPNNCVNCKFKT